MEKDISTDKRKIKKGYMDGLVIEELSKTNELFYSKYPVKYFEIKAFELLNMLNNSGNYVNAFKNEVFSIGKVELGKAEFTDEQLSDYVKIEIVSTYYHCLETFIRLLIAHATLPKCPWIELVSLDIRGYRKILKRLSSGNIDFKSQKYDPETTMLKILTGITNIKNEYIAEKGLENLIEWIKYIAHELLDVGEYNSLKHGMAILPSFGSMNINEKLKKEGDSVLILRIDEDEEREFLVQKNIFGDYDKKIGFIFFINEMINNIIHVGKLTYCSPHNGEINGLRATMMSPMEFRSKFHESNDLGYLLESYGIRLVYEEDLINLEEE